MSDDILALRWTGENLADIEDFLKDTNITVYKDGDNLYLQDSDGKLTVLPEEFVIRDDDVADEAVVSVSSESDMLATYDVEWLD